MGDNPSLDSQQEASTQDVSLFVLKLYRILESDKYIRFIRWSASGDSFIIQDSTLFATVVLPIFFKTSIFTSFVRQLNKYDFRRISDARRGKASMNHSASAFSHPYFRQNRLDLLHLITRQPAKPSGPEPVTISQNTMSFDIANEGLCSENYAEDCSSDNSSSNEHVEDSSIQNRQSLQHEPYEMNRISGGSQNESGEKCLQCQKLMSERALLEQVAQQLQSNILAKTGNPSTLLMSNMRSSYLPASIMKFQNSEILNSYPLNSSSYGNIVWPPNEPLQATRPHPMPHQSANSPCFAPPNLLISPWIPSEPLAPGSCEFHPQSQPLIEESLPASLYDWYSQGSFES